SVTLAPATTRSPVSTARSFTHCVLHSLFSSFFHDTHTTELYTLSLHDALPILISRVSELIGWAILRNTPSAVRFEGIATKRPLRSEEHTSELQSRFDLVCRLLLEKKKIKLNQITPQTTQHFI